MNESSLTMKPEFLGDSTPFRVCVETAVLAKKNDFLKQFIPTRH